MCKENQINQAVQVNNVVMENAQQQQQVQQQQPIQQQIQQQAQQQAQQQQQQPTEMEQFIQEHENLFVDGKEEKHGKMKFKVARLKGNAIHSHRAILRRDAVLEHLAENCQLDKTLAYSKTCRNALSAIQEYASLNLSKASTSTQNKKLNAAFKQISKSMVALDKEKLTLSKKRDGMKQKLEKMIAFIEEHSAVEKVPEMQNLILQIVDLDEQLAKLEKDRKLLHQHENYLDPMTNGFLEVPENQEVPAKWKKEQKSSLLLTDRSLSWKNMKDAALFPHEPSVEDINQGRLGDCYLQSALESLILTQPGRLKDCLRDNGNGTVTVRFFKQYESTDELRPAARAAMEQKHWNHMEGSQFLMRLMSELPSCQDYLPGYVGISYAKTPAFIEKQDAVRKKDNFATEEEQNAATEQFKQESNRNIEKITDNINKLFNMNATLMQQPDKLSALAQKLHDEPLIQTFLEKVTAALAKNPETEIVSYTLPQLIPSFLETFTDQEQLDALIKKYQTAMDEIRNSTEEMHPLYVTVMKEIPTHSGETYYSHGSLAVHMIQKAYAFSDLCPEKGEFKTFLQKEALQTLRKNANPIFKNIKTLEDYQNLAKSKELSPQQIALLNAEVNKLRPNYFPYENIIGGRGGQFLETLLGEKAKGTEHQPMTWNSFITDPLALLDPLTSNPPQFNHNPAAENAEENTRAAISFAVLLLNRYLGKKVGDVNTDPRAKMPITLEDISEALHGFAQWAPSDKIYAEFMENFQKVTTPNATEEEQKRELEEFIALFVERSLETLEDPKNKFTTQHRLFATKTENGKKVALYTPLALDRYEKMQDALKKGIPVTTGTKRYLPKGVSAKGLNGESVDSGIVEGHAYTVIGCQEIDGHKFVQLRNPWASKIRGYRVRVTPNPDGGEPIVTYEANHVDQKDKQEGQFLMELNDFMTRTDHIDGISQ